MRFCRRRGEERNFPDAEFLESDGLLIHLRPPAHTTDGDIVAFSNGRYSVNRGTLSVPITVPPEELRRRLANFRKRLAEGDKHAPRDRSR